MTTGPLPGWSDDALVEYFRKWAVKQSRCGFNVDEHNRIDQEKLVPSRDMLAARGEVALSKLLRLTADDNAHVRLEAAIFAFEADPRLCRKVLTSLLSQSGPVRLTALVWLIHRDPEFAAEFENMARLEDEGFLLEIARRYP
jgi:hypothetical protein